MSIDIESCCYRLQFANGQGFLIVGNNEVKPWVNKLASIMSLERTTFGSCRLPKLIFTQRISRGAGYENPVFNLDGDIKQDLPGSGWQLHDLIVFHLWSHHDIPDRIIELEPEPEPEETYKMAIVKMLLALHPFYQQVQETGGLPFHAGLVEWNRLGVLLAAPGGTGKSTCCLRLPPPWHVLCDDETLIVRDSRRQYLAHPFPTWSDYLLRRSERTWNVQQHLPLCAIFFLKQAETDDIFPIGHGQAALLISQSATQVSSRSWQNLDREGVRVFRKKLFDNACELARTIPVFILHVSLSGRFWNEMEKVLVNLKNPISENMDQSTKC